MVVDLSLYALLDPAVAGGRPLAELARLVAGHATLVQLRDKHGSTRALVEPVPFVVNDRVDVALAAEADGVHLGQDDMTAAEARLLLGKTAIIGLSVKTVAQAREAPLELIDYVAIGGVYATTSKDNTAAPIGIAGLREVVGAVRMREPDFPICAIAG